MLQDIESQGIAFSERCIMKKLRCYIAYHRNDFLPVLSVNIYGGRLADSD